jgi:hypothetical protein
LRGEPPGYVWIKIALRGRADRARPRDEPLRPRPECGSGNPRPEKNNPCVAPNALPGYSGREQERSIMKTSGLGYLWIIGGLFGLSGWATTNVDAQVNEARVLREASGIYQGAVTNSRRVRSDYTVEFSDSKGKMRVPVTENNFKTNLNDTELGGSNQAKISGDGKSADVSRGGKKVSYLIKKGVVDTLQDGHQPIKNGTARGGSVLRGGDWIGSLDLVGKRVDNDSMISTFTADTKGRH